MQGGKNLKSFVSLEIKPFLDGILIHSWFEVAVQFEFIGGGVDSVEDSIDHSPEVASVVEGALVDSLGSFGKVGVIVLNKKAVEAIEVL